MKTTGIIRGALVAALLGLAARADDLDNAFQQLVAGREYLKGFPDLKTRSGLIGSFVGGPGGAPKAPILMGAVEAAVTIRQGEPPEPSAIVSGQAPRSIQAKVIAWEALESLLSGYQYAGNNDLLNATRVAYPGSPLADDPRGMPAEEPVVFAGTAQKQITYSRLYFLQGIQDALRYVAEDTTGALRSGSTAYPTLPYYVTFDDSTSELLPHARFDDPNFGTPGKPQREPSQSVAHLYGTAMERLGLSTVAYADQLWRSAYAGPGAGLARTEKEKGQMLAHATDLLKSDIHAQFLASLPLAAQLGDGSGGTLNEFQESKIDQARVSVTAAQRLREQILAKEAPTQTALVSAWDVASLEQQIHRCKDAYTAVHDKWGGDANPPADGTVSFALTRSEEAQTINAGNAIALRQQYETQLFNITGIDPALYDNLREDGDRESYYAAIEGRFNRLFAQRDANAPELQDGSSMSVQTLRLIQAIDQVYAKKGQIDAYPQKMRVELERNDDVNATVVSNSFEIGALDASIELTHIISLSIGPTGSVSMNLDVGAVPRSELALVKAIRQGDTTVTVNSRNSQAVIANLLIEEQVAIDELPGVVDNANVAGAELRQQLATAKRLVQDHAFYQDVTDTLWYRDPSLAFKLEKAEEEYRDLLQEYRIDLYKLAKMLEASWTEKFGNPVVQANQTTVQPLNNGSFDDFTEAESVFGIANHVRGQSFYNALYAWDQRLRSPEYRGPASTVLWDANSFSGQPISLRRDLFKLIDYRYDDGLNQYVSDDAQSRQSIQHFRAILLDLAHRDPANANLLTRLRIDFPFTYNQIRVILNQQLPVPIVQRNLPAGNFDQFWNHRISKLGIKIVGKNVFAAGSTIPVSFELYGNIDRIGFFPDSLYTFSRTITSFATPLYQRDPDKRLVGEPFFGTAVGLPAAIGSTQVPMIDVGGWPLFCDNMVLRVGSQGTLRIENIDDIELYIQMQVGSPPALSPNVW